MVFSNLNCQTTDKVKYPHNTFICNDRKFLPFKFRNHAKLSSQIKLQNAIFDNCTVFIVSCK